MNVARFGHRRLFGIATIPKFLSKPNSTYVFLYYTESTAEDGEDATLSKKPIGNRLYRYELIQNRLINPKLLLNLSATPGAIGNGGKIIVGTDDNIYVTIGDVGINGHNTRAQNVIH